MERTSRGANGAHQPEDHRWISVGLSPELWDLATPGPRDVGTHSLSWQLEFAVGVISQGAAPWQPLARGV